MWFNGEGGSGKSPFGAKAVHICEKGHQETKGRKSRPNKKDDGKSSCNRKEETTRSEGKN